ncbi:MAG: efflux RND transporter permease subunit, partial [bacterium]|nr:efflux RND transporter permease subunit [bacterium]
MRITEFCVKRPIFTIIIYIVLLILSFVSLAKISVDLMPEITLPMLTVITSYSGANAQDIETKVTKTIEDAVRTVPGIDSVESTSKEGASVVIAKFEWGTSLDTASNDIRDRLEFVKSRLPDDADTPRIIKFNTSAIPILFMGANAQESYDRLNEIMETDIADQLRAVPGVGAVYVRGGKVREIQVVLDINKMNAYNISLDQVTAKIQQENVTTPAGAIYEGKKKYSLRVPGEYTTVPELGRTLLAYRQGKPIYVSDIAEIKDDFQEAIKRVHVNQKNGGFIVVQKQSGANTVTVAKGVREKLKTILQVLPKDVDVKILMDNSDFIVNSIDNLKGSVYWGGLLVVLVLLFFLRNLRASFIVALEIPISLLVAFIVVYFNGWTINVLTLTSFAIAIGMVVDNAIVVIDNIYRHLSEGERPQEAAIFGTGEIGAAILGSTLTTIVIFLPLIFVGGFLQTYFKQLAFIVTTTLMASLFVAYTLSPMLAGSILSQKTLHSNNNADTNKLVDRFFRWSEKWFERMDEKYRQILGWALNNRKKVIGGATAIFIFSLLLFPLVGTEFFPREDQGFLRLRIELPRGTNVDETEKVAAKIEQILQDEVKELRMLMVDMGESREAMGSVQGGRKELSNAADFFGKLVPKDQRKRSDLEIIEAVRPKIEKIPGLVKVNFSSQDPMEAAIMGSGKPLTVELYGDDLSKGAELSDQISGMMSKVKGVKDVEVSFEQGNPEIWVRVDRDKATSLGLSVGYIANIVRGTFYGVTVSKFRDQDDEYDIFMNLNK